MGIQVLWDNDDHTILRYVYEGRWNLDDFVNARNEASKLLDTVDQQVNIIVDVRDASMALPTGIISQGRKVITASPISHPNEGITIIVGANRATRSMIEIFRTVAPRLAENLQVRFASTLEEAYEIISEQIDKLS